MIETQSIFGFKVMSGCALSGDISAADTCGDGGNGVSTLKEAGSGEKVLDGIRRSTDLFLRDITVHILAQSEQLPDLSAKSY